MLLLHPDTRPSCFFPPETKRPASFSGAGLVFFVIVFYTVTEPALSQLKNAKDRAALIMCRGWYHRLRAPAIISTTPPAMSTALTAGWTFWCSTVSTPTDTGPAL